MTSCLRFLAVAYAAIPCLLLAQPSAGQSDDEPGCGQKPSSAQTHEDCSPGAMPLPDVVLSDQNGRQVHFFSDLVKNRVVAINFIFTSCEAICPRMGETFGELQRLMADRIGRDVFLISISIDPLTDTPRAAQGLESAVQCRTGLDVADWPKARGRYFTQGAWSLCGEQGDALGHRAAW
jgi:cytochrome oxidase Cu insertion factor (SCO1/SenC/PrrC family)